jgi:hypothetical protein
MKVKLLNAIQAADPSHPDRQWMKRWSAARLKIGHFSQSDFMLRHFLNATEADLRR